MHPVFKNYYKYLLYTEVKIRNKTYNKTTLNLDIQFLLEIRVFFNTTACPYELRGASSLLWPKCNRLLRLGRP
jgi:hypothetical protein